MTAPLASVEPQTGSGSRNPVTTHPQTRVLPLSETQRQEKGNRSFHTQHYLTGSIEKQTCYTHLIPGDGVIESIDGLVLACNRVVVGDIKLCIFLNHIFGLPHRLTAANKLGHT